MAPVLGASTYAAVATILVGLLLLAWGLASLRLRRQDRRIGAFVGVDDGLGRPLRSERYRISGRPDAIRRLPDGRLVAVERKSRSTPRRGPPRSHRVQVAAYSLLLEETTGRPPPHGVLLYADGGRFTLPWDADARTDLLRVRAAMARPYEGEARPSPARCRRCPWRPHCDARAA